jgi:hypothetical protein
MKKLRFPTLPFAFWPRSGVALCLLALTLTSCEDVIDIDLNEADSQYVIQGAVTNETGPYTVTIQQSVPFDEQNNYPQVSGATVVISDGTLTDTLTEVQPGKYQTVRLLQGQPGNTYTLNVVIDEQVFTAQSTMPPVVLFEDLTTTTMTFGNSLRIQMVPRFKDPLGLGNYYRFVQWNNGERLSNIFVIDDSRSDGLVITRPLLTTGLDFKAVAGDSVTVEMQTIDRNTYKYLYALDASSSNGPNASTPANPDNNFGGACLGYFSAHTVQRKTILVE